MLVRHCLEYWKLTCHHSVAEQSSISRIGFEETANFVTSTPILFMLVFLLASRFSSKCFGVVSNRHPDSGSFSKVPSLYMTRGLLLPLSV